MSEGDDVAAIRALVEKQFASLSWDRSTSARWDAFAGDFHPDALLFPSARPVRPMSVSFFVDRMKGLADSSLRIFEEAVLGSDIRVFGAIAVATVACEVSENETATSRNIEMMLLVKEDGAWRIVAQAWDGASSSRPVPADLL
jgi:hypothetical protein